MNTEELTTEQRALDLLRELWSYEGDDICEGILAVEKYCRTIERRAFARDGDT